MLSFSKGEQRREGGDLACRPAGRGQDMSLGVTWDLSR